MDERLNLPSASSMDGDIRCLGKRALCDKIPKEGNASTERGNRIHEVLEGKNNLESLAESDRITASLIMYDEGNIVEKEGFEACQVIREERIFMNDDKMNPIYSSKMDCLYIKGDSGLLIDYKTGFGYTVPINKNWQIRTMAVCAAEQYQLKTIRCAMLHPHHPDSRMELVTYSELELKKFKMELQEWVAMMTPEAIQTPNFISCQYCQAKLVCKAFQVHVKEQAEMKVIPASLTPSERGERLKAFKEWENLIDDEREFYKENLSKNPDFVDGWKMKESGSIRSISDSEKAVEIATKSVGDKVGKCLKFDLGAFEAVLVETGLKKKEATERANLILSDVIKFTKKKPSLSEAV